MPPLAVFYLGAIILTWAGNWPLMKLALGQVPPFLFVLLRLAGSLALIAPVATRQRLAPEHGERLGLFWVGQLQVAGFLVCSIIGLSIMPAGRAGRSFSPIRCRCGRSRSASFCGRSRRAAIN
jgi:drug/metabolite transporter (DMT)-like permease